MTNTVTSIATPLLGEIKDYGTFENERNKRWPQLYLELIQRAYGRDKDVMVGHHISFQPHGDVTGINEIPAADTLLFDHAIMLAVFGRRAYAIIADIAQIPDEGRERVVERELRRVQDSEQAVGPYCPVPAEHEWPGRPAAVRVVTPATVSVAA